MKIFKPIDEYKNPGKTKSENPTPQNSHNRKPTHTSASIGALNEDFPSRYTKIQIQKNLKKHNWIQNLIKIVNFITGKLNE